jgi:membrane protein YdbS with pleckstrin-like domain
MPYPDSLLHRGERVVLRKNPSAKVLIWPIIFLILIIGGASAMIAWSRSWQDSGFTSHTQWLIAIIVVAVILLVWLVIAPFLRWKTEHFVLSTGHIFFRTGLVRRREHQIPLSRIQNIETVVSFWGRILGYGSLVVESAADQPLEFQNVSQITKVQSTLNQLIADDRAHDPNDNGQGDDPPRREREYDRPAESHDRGPATGQTREYQQQEYQRQEYQRQGPQQEGTEQEGTQQQTPRRPTQQYPPAQSGYATPPPGTPQQGYPDQGPVSGYAPPTGGPPNPGWQPDQ